MSQCIKIYSIFGQNFKPQEALTLHFLLSSKLKAQQYLSDLLNVPFSAFSFIAVNSEGKEIFLRDIWPTREEIQAVERTFVIPSMFKEVYEKIEVV